MRALEDRADRDGFGAAPGYARRAGLGPEPTSEFVDEIFSKMRLLQVRRPCHWLLLLRGVSCRELGQKQAFFSSNILIVLLVLLRVTTLHFPAAGEGR